MSRITFEAQCRRENESPSVSSPLRDEYSHILNGTNLSIINGDALTILKTLPSNSVHCCITSPPYYRQRDYGVAGQIGQERSVETYIEQLVGVFHEVKRVLHQSGTLWINIGDGYSKKQLQMVPARVAMAMQDDEWFLRADIAWVKTAPMPESVTDRPTRAWEPIYLLSKNARYFYDAEAVNEASLAAKHRRSEGKAERMETNGASEVVTYSEKPNLRDAWQLGPEPFHGLHFAPFPTEIPRRAILAGTSEKGCCPRCFAPWQRIVSKRRIAGVYGGLRKRADAPGAKTSRSSVFRNGAATQTATVGWRPTCECGLTETVPCAVLDVFGGSGTTGQVALELGRRSILIELNPEFCELSRQRCLNAGQHRAAGNAA